jgi:hypothetical protein
MLLVAFRVVERKLVKEKIKLKSEVNEALVADKRSPAKDCQLPLHHPGAQPRRRGDRL